MTSQFISAGDRPENHAAWGQAALISYPHMGAKDAMVIEVTLQPGQGRKFHKQPHQEEIVYVLEGKLEQWIEDQKQTLNVGDSAFIAANVVHASFNKTDQPVRYLAVLAPCVGENGVEVDEVYDQSPWKDLA